MKKNMKYLSVQFLMLMILLLPAFSGRAQDSTFKSGNIQVIRDDKVDLLVSKHVQINQNRTCIDGYRIQIFFDSGNNSKTKAQSIYGSFKEKYPAVGAYLTFSTPNYKVRVGDFRTKLEAKRFLNEIIGQYPNAWIIADKISPPKIDTQNSQP
jgi:hypothetical protein